MIKTLKLFTKIGSLIILGFFTLAVYDFTTFLDYFTGFTFSILITYAFFTHQLFIQRNGMSFFMTLLVTLLIYLAPLFNVVGLVEVNTFERSWPLIFSLLIFQSSINIVSLLGFFTLSIPKRIIDIVTLVLVVLLQLSFILIFLLNIADEVFFRFMLPGTVGLYFLVLFVVLTQKKGVYSDKSINN